MQKIIISFLICVFLIPVNSIARVDAPHQVGGLTLGSDMENHEALLRMDTLMPLRNSRYIHEVEAKSVPGFKSGLVWLGNCASPGKILRIKMRYDDPSKSFYKKLLKKYKQKFGEPSEWRGDPFHIVIAWKWHFVDKDNNSISMILQHNTRDEDESIGNSVKLTMWNLIQEERACFEKKTAAEVKKQKRKKSSTVDWDALLPR